MRVVFDHQCFLGQPHGGITRYFIELVAGLRRRSEVVVGGWAGVYQSKALVPFRGLRVPMWLARTRGVRRVVDLYGRKGFEHWARTVDADIYHPTYYDNLKGPVRAKRIVTIHDCIPEKYPDLRASNIELIHKKRSQLQLADHILCVSNKTKDDLCEIYRVREDRVSVVYHGVSMSQEPEIEMPHARPYLLFVGQRGGYKNFTILKESFQLGNFPRDDFDLVCAGGPPLDENEYVGGATIRHVRDPGDAELAHLYAHAVALVYPSRYEGFGLPVLEALYCGCPVVTTRGGAIPEVAGDAVEYFDPDSAEDLLRAIKSVTFSSEHRRALIDAGRRRVAEFTWDRCVAETARVYQKALGFNCEG